MPKRTDLRSILIVGSGPIRIGQGCEFDYSGAQACRVLRDEGYRVVLVNSNPATIMTDPEWADATYLEPLDADTVAAVIERERPDALLPTLGGQTALNLAVELAESGRLGRRRADRRRPRRDPPRRGPARLPRGDDARPGCRCRSRSSSPRSPSSRTVPLPAVVRPAFTLGGTGGGLASTLPELAARIEAGLAASPIGQVLVERSVAGWQEFELEVMCDAAGNCVVVCSIENLDPVGVHTGDSWTVAPQQTLDDAAYQRLRDAAFACARTVGVATGGANVQFAVDPASGDFVADRDEPARLALLRPRLEGDRLPDRQARRAARRRLHARRAPERHHRPLERGLRAGARLRGGEGAALRLREVPGRRHDARDRDARDRGVARARAHLPGGAAEGARRSRGRATSCPSSPGCTPTSPPSWTSIRAAEDELVAAGDVRAAKRFGLPDARIARLLGLDEPEVRARRDRPGRLAVDSCAAEFEARTPYYYLSHEQGDPVEPPSGRAIVILGSGPNRIGQGIEFDYSLHPRGAGVPRGSATSPCS